jgi:DNA polymerase-3 subunit epsilon/ATP-dependent DNA helicase DinG
MPSIVAIDIETTGLDPRRDAIIEIGAVRFNEEGIQNEWRSFVNPGRPIPPFISQLTGIRNEDVVHAPTIRSVAAELAVFVEESPVLGQNVGFDLSFIRQNGILVDNPSLDTFELASILLPTARRYNLGALAIELGLPITEDLHRALDDARLTVRVYQELFRRMTEGETALTADLLSEILRLSEPFEWGGRLPFEWAFRKIARQGITGKRVNTTALFEKETGYNAPLKPQADMKPLDIDEVAAYLENGGAFQKQYPNFEYRIQQVEMLRKVTEAFNYSGHLLVEAATGTGKSYAYLLPAALWALKNNARVVISTNTINLQEQLIKKDIPALKAILDDKLQACVLKGKNNYLCPRRLDAARLRPSNSVEELRVVSKVLVWLTQGGSGDRTEINLTGPDERDAWTKLSADDEACSIENCIKRTGGACPFYRARQAAQSAHLIVVNHALLLADVVTGSRVLPEYNYLIIDEGHHLEEATTSALSFRLTQPELERLLRELGGSSSGILGRFLNIIQKTVTPGDLASQEKEVKQSTDAAARLQNSAFHFFRSLDEFLKMQSNERQQVQYSQQVRIVPATRNQPDWTEVELVWDDLLGTFKLLLAHLSTIYKWMGDKFSDASDDLVDVQGSLANFIRRLTEIQINLNGLVSAPAPDQIYWVELNNTGTKLSLNAAPLTVGPLMQQHLWNNKNSVVVTSATLTTAGDFGYIRGRLNAEDADELAVGSPFDYESAALLYLMNDIPEPTMGSSYQNELNNNLLRLCKTANGRTLVLFTSYSQLKQTSTYLGPALADKGITVYEQGEGASAASLLESFKSSEKSVLLGTRSFWEGVDIPGQALSVLVITKLPFDVPSDPIIAARAETFEDPFNEYNLPEAILKFRQGFGRLIRSQSDRGAVVIMDKRILSKKYGRLFLDSLPQCTTHIGSSIEMPKIVEKWLG